MRNTTWFMHQSGDTLQVTLARPEPTPGSFQHLLDSTRSRIETDGIRWAQIDLDAAEALDRADLALLVPLNELLRQRGGGVTLLKARPNVRQQLRRMGIDRAFRLEPFDEHTLLRFG